MTYHNLSGLIKILTHVSHSANFQPLNVAYINQEMYCAAAFFSNDYRSRFGNFISGTTAISDVCKALVKRECMR
jgi:hypothetical protein